MKRIALALAAVLAAAPVFCADLVDRVLIRVNDQIVSQDQFNARLDQMRKNPSAPTDLRQLELAVIEQIINEKLIDERAQALHIVIGKDEIDDAVNRVKTQYGLKTQEEFEQALKTSGTSLPALRGQLKQAILTREVTARDLPITLDDNALRTEYEKTKDKDYTVPQRARISEIVCRYDPLDPASRAAAQKKIDAAARAIAGGMSFADAAKKFSEGTTTSTGGDIGIVAKGDLQPELDAAVFGGSSAGPIESKNAFYLLSATQRQPAGYKPFDDVKEDIRRKMSEEIYEKKFTDYLEGLRKAAFVKIFDKELAEGDAALQQKGSNSDASN